MPQRKYSRQRESIIENLKCRTDHPSAEMVYEDIKKIYPNISLATVYRNLSLLLEEARIRKIVTEDGILRFDYNVEPHDHFICRRCGNISDLHMLDTKSFKNSASKNLDGMVEECVMTFYGSCENCSKSL